MVAQTRPVPKNHAQLPELKNRLARALGGDSSTGVLGLAWSTSAVDEAENASAFKLVGNGGRALG